MRAAEASFQRIGGRGFEPSRGTEIGEWSIRPERHERGAHDSLFSAERHILRWTDLPMGVSILCVASKGPAPVQADPGRVLAGAGVGG